MPARLWNRIVLLRMVMVAGTSGILVVPSFVQAKDPMPTFDLNHIIDLALERNPMIAGAESVMAQGQGRRTEAGAYPNPTIGLQTADATIRDPSNGVRLMERGVTVNQTGEWPGTRAARRGGPGQRRVFPARRSVSKSPSSISSRR